MKRERITVHEAARRLNRHPILVYRWIAQGRLRAERYVRSLLIPERELERFLKHAPERRRPHGRKGRR